MHSLTLIGCKPTISFDAQTDDLTSCNGIIYCDYHYYFIWGGVFLFLFIFFVGIVTKEKASTVRDVPPFLPFVYYFWIAIFSVFMCALLIVLNAVLRVCTVSNSVLGVDYY